MFSVWLFKPWVFLLVPLSSNQMKLCRDIIVQSICSIVSPNTVHLSMQHFGTWNLWKSWIASWPRHTTCRWGRHWKGVTQTCTVHALICGCINRQQRNSALSWWPSYQKLLCVHNLNWYVLVKDKCWFFIHPVYTMPQKTWMMLLTEKLVFFVHVWALQQNLASGDVLCLGVGSWI